MAAHKGTLLALHEMGQQVPRGPAPAQRRRVRVGAPEHIGERLSFGIYRHVSSLWSSSGGCGRAAFSVLRIGKRTREPLHDEGKTPH